MEKPRFGDLFPELRSNKIGRFVIRLAGIFEDPLERLDNRLLSWTMPKLNKFMSTEIMAQLENSILYGLEQPLVPDNMRKRWKKMTSHFPLKRTNQ